MATYRRYRPARKSSGHALPLTAIGLTAAALLLWGAYSKGHDILTFFKGQTIIVPSNKEANDNLEKLLADLSGDKAGLLELAESSKLRLGWIENENTRRQFRWFLMSRLVDKGQWEEAVRILPEVESLAPVEGLDRLAEAARQHGDYELQLRLDRELQDKLMLAPEQTPLLLRSVRRSAETCIAMQRSDEAVKAIARLDAPAVLARLKEPALAAEAAELQMLRADVCEVKEPVLQLVRNILEQAKWPLCPATSRLMLEEVTTTLRDNKNLSPIALREIEEKLLHCRDSMLENPDREHRLPTCYTLLGELRYRLQNYEGCSQALSLAAAFAEGYGEMTKEMQIRLRRLRSRANEARGALPEAVQDCRYLLEHDSDPAEQLRCLSLMAQHAEGEEKIELLNRCWDALKQTPALAGKDPEFMARIANELAAYYTEKEDYPNGIKWVGECTNMLIAANPDLTNGVALAARYRLAMLNRKAKNDATACRLFREIVRDIEQLSEEDRAKLDGVDAKLHRNAVREVSRSYLLMGDKDLAKLWIRKIRESLPDKVR